MNTSNNTCRGVICILFPPFASKIRFTTRPLAVVDSIILSSKQSFVQNIWRRFRHSLRHRHLRAFQKSTVHWQLLQSVSPPDAIYRSSNQQIFMAQPGLHFQGIAPPTRDHLDQFAIHRINLTLPAFAFVIFSQQKTHWARDRLLLLPIDDYHPEDITKIHEAKP